MLKRIVNLTLLMGSVLSTAALAVTPAAMKGDLEARYALTRMDILGFMKESGSILVVRREGLRAGRAGAFNRANVIRGEVVTESGGGNLPLGGGLDGGLKPGEQVRVLGIKVDEHLVELDLATVNTHVLTGSRSPVPLQALVSFRYDGGLVNLTASQVLSDVDMWFGSEHAMRMSKIVRQGQTPEEVITILGEPEKKVLLESKSVFIYSDMKLVFRNGRLVDLE